MTGRVFRLRYLIQDRFQRSAGKYVIFRCKDLSGRRIILLNKKVVLVAMPGATCDKTIDVEVTSKPKPKLCSKMIKGKYFGSIFLRDYKHYKVTCIVFRFNGETDKKESL